MDAELRTPLSPLQIELLKMFSMQNVDEQDLKQIKVMLSKYFANKASALAQKKAEESEWTKETIESLQYQHNRHTVK